MWDCQWTLELDKVRDPEQLQAGWTCRAVLPPFPGLPGHWPKENLQPDLPRDTESHMLPSHSRPGYSEASPRDTGPAQ